MCCGRPLEPLAPKAESERAACLLQQDFEPRRKTLFAALGLLYYLTQDEISRLFAHLAAIAAEDSSLIFDPPDDHLLSSGDARVQMMRRMAAQCGEPMRPSPSRLQLEKLLAENSFIPAEYMTLEEIQERYFDSTGIQAFPHVHLCHAGWKA